MPRKSRNTWRPNRVQNLKDRNCSSTWPIKSRPLTGTREEAVEAEAEGVVEEEEEARVVRTRTFLTLFCVITECWYMLHQSTDSCSPLVHFMMIFFL